MVIEEKNKFMNEIVIEAKSEEGLMRAKQEFEVASQQRIFQDIETSKLHSKLIVIGKYICAKVEKFLQYTSPEMRKWRWVHKVVKKRLIHKLLRFIERFMGKYVLSGFDEIKVCWWNNHIRMLYNCAELALDDMYTHMIYEGNVTMNKINGKEPPVFDEYMNTAKKSPSYLARKLLLRLWTTEVLEDTVDREWMNMFMMRAYWAMHDFYKGKVPRPGQFPVYDTTKPRSIVYFFQNRNMPVWQPQELNKEVKEDGKNHKTKRSKHAKVGQGKGKSKKV